MSYEIILADPPWGYRDSANAGKWGAVYKYPTLSLPEIYALDVLSIGLRCLGRRLLSRRPLARGRGGKDIPPRLLAAGARMVSLAAADDWLNDHETLEAAHKTRRWLNEPPTEKQLAYLLPPMRADYGLTRYQASCLLSFQFNKGAIWRLVFGARESRREAA